MIPAAEPVAAPAPEPQAVEDQAVEETPAAVEPEMATDDNSVLGDLRALASARGAGADDSAATADGDLARRR